jgi:hypothetical protein
MAGEYQVACVLDAMPAARHQRRAAEPAWGQTADPASDRRDLPAREARRQVGRQPDDRCPVPGLAALRWRTGDEQPPAAVRITSPDEGVSERLIC